MPAISSPAIDDGALENIESQMKDAMPHTFDEKVEETPRMPTLTNY